MLHLIEHLSLQLAVALITLDRSTEELLSAEIERVFEMFNFLEGLCEYGDSFLI